MKQINAYKHSMKNIKNYINERLHVTTKSHLYSCQPKTRDELQEIIIRRIKDDGPECDLNDIDVSKITDMSNLCSIDTQFYGDAIFKNFNGDISLWNVSNVVDMCSMFSGCEEFNCDLSKWNVSKVINMSWMFDGCFKFNCDLSHWDVSNVTYMNGMFNECQNFIQNLNKWDVSNAKETVYMFDLCPTQPKWYKYK